MYAQFHPRLPYTAMNQHSIWAASLLYEANGEGTALKPYMKLAQSLLDTSSGQGDQLVSPTHGKSLNRQ